MSAHGRSSRDANGPPNGRLKEQEFSALTSLHNLNRLGRRLDGVEGNRTVVKRRVLVWSGDLSPIASGKVCSNFVD